MRRVVRALVQSGLFVSVLLGVSAVSMSRPVQATGSMNGNRPTYQYPEAVVQTYVQACGSAATDRVPQPVMREICLCTIEAFQDEFSLPEFRAIGQAIQAARDVPPAMNLIMSDCVQQVMLRPDV
ncbi:MAG: hypothetical protein HC805_08950 [Alkalinema sp. RL_2_19]|nr:hypothetical protein [Alkalinema sp. RL_2_19]